MPDDSPEKSRLNPTAGPSPAGGKVVRETILEMGFSGALAAPCLLPTYLQGTNRLVLEPPLESSRWLSSRDLTGALSNRAWLRSAEKACAPSSSRPAWASCVLWLSPWRSSAQGPMSQCTGTRGQVRCLEEAGHSRHR
jgi:hypothetical protein